MPRDYSSAEKMWQGVEDAKLRRKLQNRLNQRLSRKRKTTQREAIAQTLAARRDSLATVPIPILPKPTGVQSTGTEHLNPATRVGKGDVAVCHTHQVASQQVLCAPRLLPRGISDFSAACPDLADAHYPRVFQFTITEMLATVGIQTVAGDPLQVALCRAAMSDPLLFHAVVAGGASQLIFRTNSIEDNRVLLKGQSYIARAVRQQISAGITTISDSVLFAIMAMAVKQNTYLLSLAPKDRYVGDFDTPVKPLGGLAWMGLIDFAPNHTFMWMHLLRARNPSLINKVPGIIDWLQASDLLSSSALLQKPRMEMQETYILLADKAAAIRPDTSEAGAFHVDAHFKEIILDIRICCRHIETFSGHEHPQSPEASKFVFDRNLILYRLLSLPPGVSEICRLAVLIFNYGVLYPYPDPRLLWNLSRQLGAILSVSRNTKDEDAGFLLWAAMIGGIAAAGTTVYDSFAETVNEFADMLALKEWPQIMALLESFIWLERACGVGGRTLWARARALSSKVTDPPTS